MLQRSFWGQRMIAGQMVPVWVGAKVVMESAAALVMSGINILKCVV